MALFIALDPVPDIAWRKRLAGWQRQYARASRPWTSWRAGTSPRPRRASRTRSSPGEASTFLSLLFEHTVEGMYSNPEYGGNRGLAGWTDIGYPATSSRAATPRARSSALTAAIRWPTRAS